LPGEAISRLGKAAPRLSRWIAPDPIRAPLHAVPQRLGRGSSARRSPDDRLAAADEALRRTERSDRFCWMPEALRVKGEAPLLSDKADTTAVEDHFRRSLDLARRQGALSWELRTATSLGRLRRDENRIGEAYDLVSSVYDRFSEGFGTANLKAESN
jgi:hypothetical protein